MPSITIEPSVECAKCKESLDADYDPRTETIKVTPCPTCLQEAHDEGFAEGRDES